MCENKYYAPKAALFLTTSLVHTFYYTMCVVKVICYCAPLSRLPSPNTKGGFADVIATPVYEIIWCPS